MTTRESIFNAGVKLFAERSYDSVGIRDITRQAGANSAMISYYFRGKSGLLQEIFSTFAAHILAVAAQSMETSETLDDLSENTVYGFLEDARNNKSLYQVGLRMFNTTNEALQELQEQLRKDSQSSFDVFLERINKQDTRPDKVKAITFTAILGIIFSDYLLGGGSFIEDKQTADIYAQTIVNIIKTGLNSFLT